MGALREKAQAEVAEHSRQAAEERERIHADRRAQLCERVEDAAKWLSRWSGELVLPDQLTEVLDRSGPPRWTIVLDGFDLELTAMGRPPERVVYDIWQRLEDGTTRPCEKPANLLESGDQSVEGVDGE